jgi:hypothetical protein
MNRAHGCTLIERGWKGKQEGEDGICASMRIKGKQLSEGEPTISSLGIWMLLIFGE